MPSTRDNVIDAIVAVAPDLTAVPIADDDDFVDDLELDSMDLLNIAIAVRERTGVDIPERDHAKLRCVADLTAYVDRANSS